MSHFLREFEALLSEYRCGSASAVFEAAGLNPATLSRIRNAGLNLQFQNLKPLAAAIGAEEMVYLRLLRARLLDECTDPRASRINIEIAGDRRKLVTSPAADSLSRLPPRQERAMRNIAAALPDDAGLRSTILWLGEELFNSDVEAPAMKALTACVMNDGGAAPTPLPTPTGGPTAPARYSTSRRKPRARPQKNSPST